MATTTAQTAVFIDDAVGEDLARLASGFPRRRRGDLWRLVVVSRCSRTVLVDGELGERRPARCDGRCARASPARSVALYADGALIVRSSHIRRLRERRAFTVSTRAAARRSRRSLAATAQQQSDCVHHRVIVIFFNINIIIVVVAAADGVHSSERSVQRWRLATTCANLQSVQRYANGARGANERRRHSSLTATLEQARSIRTKVRRSFVGVVSKY